VAEPVTLLAIVKNHPATSIRPVFGTKALEVRHIAWTRRATPAALERIGRRTEPPSIAGLVAGNALNGRRELTEVNRLDDMIEKTRFPTALLVLLHAVAADSYAFDCVAVA
jgi:hypothetical protein